MSKKVRLFGLPLKWGIQFAIALTATTVLWSVSVHWAHGNDLEQGLTAIGFAGLVMKHLVAPLLSLVCLIWIILLLLKQRLFLNQWLQLTNIQQARFSGAFVVVMLISLVAYVVARINNSRIAPSIIGDIELPIFVVWVAAFCWVAHTNSRHSPPAHGREASQTQGPERAIPSIWQKREIREVVISTFALIAVFVPPRSLESSAISGTVFLAGMAFMWSQRLSELFLNRGWYRSALAFAGIQQWNPKQARLMRGWILLESGRFAEAMTTLDPLAFDKDRKPHLQDWSYYLFATALLDHGEEAEAQDLFEAALQVPQTHKNIQFGLADCLLSQGINPAQAIELVNECLSQDWNVYSPAQKRLVVSQSIALRAWALAILRKPAESAKLLEEAFSEASQMQSRDLAALTHLKGVTLRALGDIEGARTAFERVLALFPYGAVEVRARKRLAELREATTS